MIVPDTIPDITEEMLRYAKQFDSKDDVRNYFGIYDKETVKKALAVQEDRTVTKKSGN